MLARRPVCVLYLYVFVCYLGVARRHPFLSPHGGRGLCRSAGPRREQRGWRIRSGSPINRGIL